MAFPSFGAFPTQVSQWLKSVFFVLASTLIPLLSTAQIYEAENATLSGPLVFSGQGSTGSYADFQNASGDYIEWTIPASTTADYQLDFIYQLGASSDRPLELSINGVTEVASQSFPSTGSWQVWDTVSFTASFIQGNSRRRNYPCHR